MCVTRMGRGPLIRRQQTQDGLTAKYTGKGMLLIKSVTVIYLSNPKISKEGRRLKLWATRRPFANSGYLVRLGALI